MIIQSIMQTNKEKLIAIAKRRKDGSCSPSIFCDNNTIPQTLRIFWNDSNPITVKFASFKDACKYIFSL